MSTHPVNPADPDESGASRAITCSSCKRVLPVEAFNPSDAKRAATTGKCRQCQKRGERIPSEIKARKRRDTVARLRDAIGDRQWSAKEAADILGHTRVGIGQLLEPMCRDGLIERLDVGKYRFIDTPPPLPSFEPEPVMFVRAPVMHPQIEPVFLEVGAYVFSPGTFAIERDDRGGAVITLLVSETDPRIGKALPREIELTPEEWKTRRRVTLTDIIDGNESTELFDRIGELERTVLHWRKECEAALALAQEYEQDAAKYRKVVATIG